MKGTTVLPIGRHAAIVVLLLLVPAVWLAPPVIWHLDHRLWVVLGGSTLAYLLTLLSLRGRAGASGRPSLAILLIHFGAWFGLWLLTILLWQPGYDRVALLVGLGVGLAGLLLTTLSEPSSWFALIVIAAAGLASLAGQVAVHNRWLQKVVQTPAVTIVETALYQIRLSEYTDAALFTKTARDGAGLANWGADYLLVTGEGRIFVFNGDTAAAKLRIEELPYQVPLNVAEFEAGAAEILQGVPNASVDSTRFRASGVLVQDRGETRRLLVSHHFWDSANQCFHLRVSAIEGTPEQFHAAAPALQWRTVYDAAPCLKLNTSPANANRFDGEEGGGRMVALGPEEILLSVGYHGFDGVTIPGPPVSQDLSNDYGKIMRIDLASGKARIFSSGHRNPQGLVIAPTGEIWETEHGPKGGDELNLLIEGRDYGWPSVTYGTDYSRRSWPLNPVQGHHDKFERPIQAFVPSPGLSALTSVTSDLFPLWKGDLLLASLKKGTLYRTHVRDNRVVFVEPILVGRRIRDVLFGHDGRLWLWTDVSTLIVIEPSEASDSETATAQCVSCHSIGSGEPSTSLGPSLSDILNRPVADRKDFAYSKALKQLGGRWTPERLEAFIADPQKFAPGTSMAFPGISDPKKRHELEEYFQRPPPPAL